MDIKYMLCGVFYALLKVADNFRIASKKETTRKFAEYSTKFTELKRPNRSYIPLGFMSADVIGRNANNMLSDATLYHFGLLIYNVHMA